MVRFSSLLVMTFGLNLFVRASVNYELSASTKNLISALADNYVGLLDKCGLSLPAINYFFYNDPEFISSMKEYKDLEAFANDLKLQLEEKEKSARIQVDKIKADFNEEFDKAKTDDAKRKLQESFVNKMQNLQNEVDSLKNHLNTTYSSRSNLVSSEITANRGKIVNAVLDELSKKIGSKTGRENVYLVASAIQFYSNNSKISDFLDITKILCEELKNNNTNTGGSSKKNRGRSRSNSI